ncbi:MULTISPECIES: TetR/AcrR family transcriptional regulator C-terminal domain-containing protein [unclassified Microbacterium]|uniref:TetR/AcrR family transcriptional regulator C-terminal domain-containing protein n=1 Tax=unclassified Microbacterium TaxID=2609290 RepID=UPI00109D547C|nr:MULTISPECIES: TetR/AcrR family transcriptional regulator C-terminal domain-containing protein [unclassified Microbacterium]
MAKNLVDLLWRDDSAAAGGRRGPRARHSTAEVVSRAIELADRGGLATVTIRALAQSLELPPMSIYTHVNSRDDLLVLMVDQMNARMIVRSVAGAGWSDHVRAVAEDNLDLLRGHTWLVDIADQRAALGPGTIAKYDRELHAFDETGLGDVQRDAALSFVLDFVRAAASRMRENSEKEQLGAFWAEAGPRLSTHLGEEHPLAQSVGRAAGESLGAAYDADAAWEFGLARVLDGLRILIEERAGS